MKKYVLVLGGSTFMGKELLSMLSKEEDYEVHFINRGKNYWNREVDNIPNIHFTYANREDKKDFTEVLRYLTKKLQIASWEAVIDFSCYKYSSVKCVYDALRGMVNLYVFISTDSIYDVCDKNHVKAPITEDQDVRPESQEIRNQLKKSESYGHHKLKCEEFLKKCINKPEFTFVSLRLPDVLGPYDDTNRFFALVKWLQRNNRHPIEVDDGVQTQKISFAYSLDVVSVIMSMLKQRIWEQREKVNQSYHLCCDETMTYKELVEYMAQSLVQGPVKYKHIDKAATFYPSVDCGALSNEKIKLQLGAKLTPLKQVLDETIQFFTTTALKYQSENLEAEEKLKKKLD